MAKTKSARRPAKTSGKATKKAPRKAAVKPAKKALKKATGKPAARSARSPAKASAKPLAKKPGRVPTGKSVKAAPKTAAKTAAKTPTRSTAVAAPAPASPARPSPALPAVGAPAPAFSLPASDGSTVRLSDYPGKTVVLYFYPRADTPGCTKQACGFRDAIASYRALGVPVFGVSPDPVSDVTKFASKFSLNFPLLADADHAVCDAYGVWVEKSMYGKSYMGAARTTFILRDGKVAKVFEKVNPEGHDAEVLSALKAL